MNGKIVKGIGGFYYVAAEDGKLYECKARGVFRKEKMRPLVGDDCEIEILDAEASLGNVEKVLPRRNTLTRPAVANADQAIVIFAASSPEPSCGLIDRYLVGMSYADMPVILVINKVDTIAKEEILKVIAAYRQLFDFDEILPVSALKGQYVEDVTQAIFDRLPEGPLLYDEETVTDQSMRAIAAEIIREKALRSLNEEVPHGIAVLIQAYREGEDRVDIEADLVCERDSHKGIIIGKGGSMLKKIGSAARHELEEELGCRVNLRLFVKVRKEWRNNPGWLKEFGYQEGK